MNLINLYTRAVNKMTTIISNDEVITARAVTLSALTHTVEAIEEMTVAQEESFKDQVDLIMGRPVSPKEAEVAVQVATEEADVEEVEAEEELTERLQTVLTSYTDKMTMLNSMSAKSRINYTKKKKEELIKFFCEARLEVNATLVALVEKESNEIVMNFLKENADEKDTCKYLAKVIDMFSNL